MADRLLHKPWNTSSGSSAAALYTALHYFPQSLSPRMWGRPRERVRSRKSTCRGYLALDSNNICIARRVDRLSVAVETGNKAFSLLYKPALRDSSAYSLREDSWFRYSVHMSSAQPHVVKASHHLPRFVYYCLYIYYIVRLVGVRFLLSSSSSSEILE